MNRRKLHVNNFPAFLAVTTVLWLGPSASAQSAPAQDNDTTRGELARFDQFLDGHREVAEQLRRNPSLVNNQQFVQSHPALQTFLQEHPGIREEITENPDAFMRREERFDRREDARDRETTRRELAPFDRSR